MVFSCTKEEPIRIAYVATLSGKNSELGIGGRNGIRMAIEKWNDAGGINGRQIALRIFNNEGSIEKGLQIIDSLKAHGIHIVIGPLTSNMKPVVEKGMKEGILFVSPTMSSSSLSIKDDLFVRFIGPSSYQAKLLCEEIEQRKYSSLLVFTDERNAEYTNDVYNSLMSCIHSELPELSVVKEDLKLGRNNRFLLLREMVDELKPDAVLVVSNGIDFGRVAQHIKKSSHSFLLLGARWAATQDVITHGGEAVEGAHLVGNIRREIPTPKETAFVTTYKERHNEIPSFIPFFVYDAADGLFTAMKSCGSEDPIRVRDEILEISKFETLQGFVEIDSLGDAYRDIIQIVTIKKGVMIPCPKDH